MRRMIRSDKETALLKKIEQEHALFKYKMLASPAREIYDSCNKIRFYESIYEYFQYCSTIEQKFTESCLKETDVIASLWALYVEHEYLKIDTWEDIEEALCVQIRWQETHPV